MDEAKYLQKTSKFERFWKYLAVFFSGYWLCSYVNAMEELSRAEILSGVGVVYSYWMSKMMETRREEIQKHKELMTEEDMGEALTRYHAAQYTQTLQAPAWKLYLPF